MSNHNDLVQQVILEIYMQLGSENAAFKQQLLNETAAAVVLQVERSTLQNWRCTGRYDLPFVKIGRLVRYRIVDLAEWIIKHRSGNEG